MEQIWCHLKLFYFQGYLWNNRWDNKRAHYSSCTRGSLLPDKGYIGGNEQGLWFTAHKVTSWWWHDCKQFAYADSGRSGWNFCQWVFISNLLIYYRMHIAKLWCFKSLFPFIHISWPAWVPHYSVYFILAYLMQYCSCKTQYVNLKESEVSTGILSINEILNCEHYVYSILHDEFWIFILWK